MHENENIRKVPSSCAIRISLKEHTLHIHKSAIAILNRPKYIQLLINKKTNILFLKGCEVKEKNTFAVPKKLFLHSRNHYEMQNRTFTDAIQLQLCWEPGGVYRLTGELLPDLQVIAFDLNKCQRLNKDISISEQANLPDF